MTAYRLTDQQLGRALIPPAEVVAPMGLLDDVSAAVAAQPQRRPSRLPWAAPMPDPRFGRRPVPLAIRLAVAAALLAAALWVALIVASQQLPTGQLAGRIIFVSANYELVAVDPRGGAPIVIKDVEVGGPPVWSRDGHRFAIASTVAGGFGIDIRDSAGDLVKRLHAPPESGGLGGIAWAPDRSRLIAVFTDGGVEQLFMYQAEGELADPVNITPDGMLADAPAFSPDGRSVAFIGRQRGTSQLGLWLQSLEDRSIRLVTAGAGGFPPAFTSYWVSLSWSPAGSEIAYEARAPLSRTAIFAVGIDGTGLRRLAPDLLLASAPTWSPDGGLLAFDAAGTAQNGRSSVWTTRPDGSGVRRVLPDAYLRGWTPQNEILAVTPACDWGASTICRQSLVIVPAAGVTSVTDPTVRVVIDNETLQAAHDGKSFVPGISDGTWPMDPRLWKNR